MEFSLLMTHKPVYVFCKFKMYIIKIALVISENVRIAFLYVLSICLYTAIRPRRHSRQVCAQSVSIRQCKGSRH